MIVSICLLLMLQQEPGESQRYSPADKSGPGIFAPLHGTITGLYRVRWSSDEDDNDLYELLNARYGDPQTDLLSASLSARFAEDLDSQRKVDGFYVFNSLDDTYKLGQTAQVYTAYVTLSRPLPGLTGQFGRQIVDELPEAVPLDGALLKYQMKFLNGSTLGAFGGRQADLWKSSTTGDLMYGGWAEVPWSRRGRARIEYLHIEDENLFGLFKDDLAGLTLHQGIGPASTYARYTALEGNSRDLTARATLPLKGIDLTVDGQLNYVFKDIRALALPLDPYSTFLVKVEPYVQSSFRASQGITEKISVDGAATFRQLVDKSEKGPFNREFQHWSLTPRATHWPLPNLSLSLSFDYWRSHNDYWTLGGDATYDLVPKRIEVGAGTSFTLYSIDAFTGTERQRVREVYLTTKWKLVEGTIMDVKFAIDRDDFDTFNTLDVGVRRAF